MDTVRVDAAAGVETTPDGARVHLIAAASRPREWAYGGSADATDVPAMQGTAQLIPYYRWGSRGPTMMRVFTPVV